MTHFKVAEWHKGVKVKLLIVDDSTIIRNRIARILIGTELNHIQIVGLAKNGKEALECYDLWKPELITMDLTMPEMDGIECIERIIKLNPATRILVISALSDKATALLALKKGAQGFLYKPFTDDQLIVALLEMLS